MGITMDKRQIIIELLSKVLAGTITPEAALDAWPEVLTSDDKITQNAWHSLYHYSIDDDIRARDSSYAARQRSALQEIVAALKQSSS